MQQLGWLPMQLRPASFVFCLIFEASSLINSMVGFFSIFLHLETNQVSLGTPSGLHVCVSGINTSHSACHVCVCSPFVCD